MITRRKVFKEPLCTSCTNFLDVKMQDGTRITQCQGYSSVPLTPDNLATECTGFNDKLREAYWKEFNQATMEIPIIGQKKTVKAGFIKEKEE
jgi:hypothetical protein